MYYYTTRFTFMALVYERFTGYVSILFSVEQLWQGCLPEENFVHPDAMKSLYFGHFIIKALCIMARPYQLDHRKLKILHLSLRQDFSQLQVPHFSNGNTQKKNLYFIASRRETTTKNIKRHSCSNNFHEQCLIPSGRLYECKRTSW